VMKALLIATIALALGALGYFFLAPPPQASPEPRAETGPTAGKPAPVEEKLTLQTSADAAEVFRRAFWREPAPEDRILHAERREWVSEEDGVRRWQWFLAVKAGVDLDQWLREQNPFSLVKRERPSPSAADAVRPAWFPAGGDLAGFEVQQAADGGMVLIFDPTTKTLFATDVGHGFAASAHGAGAPDGAAPRESGYRPEQEQPRRSSVPAVASAEP